MMPAHPMPAIGLGLLIRPGAFYDTHHHWRAEDGELRASVGFNAGGTSHGHIQGPPGRSTGVGRCLGRGR
jgi:hypothetical protein